MLLTWPIINRVIRHSEVKVGKKSQKDEKKNFADSDEAAWNEFCQIVKIHIVIRGEVYSATDLKNICNEIRTAINLSSFVRSIDIKYKLKNTFNENMVFKKNEWWQNKYRIRYV